MATNSKHASYRTYVGTWAALLTLTVGMLVTGYFPLTPGLILVVLLIAMLAKASLIGAYFMHLRFERPGLVLAVVLGLLATAGLLFGILALDGLHVLNLLAE